MEKLVNSENYSLQNWLRAPVLQIKEVWRWGRFKMHSYIQNTLDHTVEQTLLTIIALILEIKIDERVNPFAITVAALIHDFGERPRRKFKKMNNRKWRYDICVPDKIANAETLQDIERKRVYDYFDRLPIIEPYKSQIIDFLVASYEIQYETKTLNGEFFNILEQLGYILHAYKEYMQHHYYEYDEVFRNNHYSVVAACKKFRSIKIIYSPYIDEIEKALLKKPT